MTGSRGVRDGSSSPLSLHTSTSMNTDDPSMTSKVCSRVSSLLTHLSGPTPTQYVMAISTTGVVVLTQICSGNASSGNGTLNDDSASFISAFISFSVMRAGVELDPSSDKEALAKLFAGGVAMTAIGAGMWVARMDSVWTAFVTCHGAHLALEARRTLEGWD